MENQQPSQTNSGVTNLPLDEYHDFNHYYNIEMCVMNCVNKSYNLPEFIVAVDMFEITLVSDLDSDLKKKLDEISFKLNEELGRGVLRPHVQFMLAKEKYRLLYGFMKRQKISKAVLAIGRPKCHKCGATILWNRDERVEAKKKGEVNGNSEPKPEPTAELPL